MIRLQDPLRAISRAHFRGIRERYVSVAYPPMQRSDSSGLTGKLKFLSLVSVRWNIAAQEAKSVITTIGDDRDSIISRIGEPLERLEAQHKTCV